jgi:hypothetical protein
MRCPLLLVNQKKRGEPGKPQLNSRYRLVMDRSFHCIATACPNSDRFADQRVMAHSQVCLPPRPWGAGIRYDRLSTLIMRCSSPEKLIQH